MKAEADNFLSLSPLGRDSLNHLHTARQSYSNRREQTEVFEAAYLKRKRTEFAEIRAVFDAYIPGNEDIYGKESQNSLFTPKFAYDLRLLYGGNAPEDALLYRLTDKPEVFLHIETQQKIALTRILHPLARAGIPTVGDLRSITLSKLVDIRGITDKNKVFAQVAFEKF